MKHIGPAYGVPYYVHQAEKELHSFGSTIKITLYFFTVSEILTIEEDYLRLFEVETEELLARYLGSSMADSGTDPHKKPSFSVCLCLSSEGSGNSTETDIPTIYYYLVDPQRHRIGSLHGFCFKDHRISNYRFLPTQVLQVYGVD